MTFLEAMLKTVVELVDFGEVVTHAVEKDRCLPENVLGAHSAKLPAGVVDDSQHVVSLDSLADNKLVD
jgi:hypothetical protein